MYGHNSYGLTNISLYKQAMKAQKVTATKTDNSNIESMYYMKLANKYKQIF